MGCWRQRADVSNNKLFFFGGSIDLKESVNLIPSLYSVMPLRERRKLSLISCRLLIISLRLILLKCEKESSFSRLNSKSLWQPHVRKFRMKEEKPHMAWNSFLTNSHFIMRLNQSGTLIFIPSPFHERHVDGASNFPQKIFLVTTKAQWEHA